MTSNYFPDKTRRLITVLIFLFTAVVYIATLGNGFVYDDNFVVMDNPLIRGGAPVSEYFFNNVWSFFAEESKANFYRPLQLVLYRAEFAAFKLTPWPWHLVNLILHALNASLVFLLALALLPPMKSEAFGSERTSLLIANISPVLTALIFAFHPVNVEPVAWVSSVSDLLFVFFFLLGFLLYIKSKGEGRGLAGAYAVSLGSFSLALLSKETAIVFIPVIFLYDLFFRGLKIRDALKALIPFVALAILYLMLRTYALGGITQKEVTELSTPLALLNIFPIFFSYISKLVFPMNLTVIYEFDPVVSLFAPSVLAGVVLFLVFIFLFFRYRKEGVVPLSLSMIVLPLVPILYVPAVSTGGFAERYLYLSTAGFGLFVAYCFIRGVEEVALRHKEGGPGRVLFFNSIITVSLVIVLVLYSLGTIKRIGVWKDDLTLWNDAVSNSPKSAIAHYNTGTVYDKQRKFPEALWHYQNAARLDPSYSVAFYNIGSIMARAGRFEDAAHYYSRAVGADPEISEYQMSLAHANMAGGNAARAIEVLDNLLAAQPELKEALELREEARVLLGR